MGRAERIVRKFGFCNCGRLAPDKPLERGWHQTGIGPSLVLVCPACSEARGLRPPVVPGPKPKKPKEKKSLKKEKKW